ncbi:MAG: hypothetical protein OFPII_03790 [Osedax symbiont Rs1]|nr:MAG: hypothetical protein OFPII_03790 [Osedax symbiont Rs1]
MQKFERLVDDIAPLSAMQAGMLAQCQRQSELPLYIEQMVVQLDGQLKVDAWQHAWQQLHDAHPALRTSIHNQGLPEPHQVVWRTQYCPLPFIYHDWQQSPVQTFEQLAGERRDNGFDMNRPGLYQIDLIQLAADQYIQIITISHLIIDG